MWVYGEVGMWGGGVVMCGGGYVGIWGGGYMGRWGGGEVGWLYYCGVLSVVSIPVQPAVFQTWSLSDSWSSFHTSLQTGKGNLSHH